MRAELLGLNGALAFAIPVCKVLDLHCKLQM